MLPIAAMSGPRPRSAAIREIASRTFVRTARHAARAPDAGRRPPDRVCRTRRCRDAAAMTLAAKIAFDVVVVCLARLLGWFILAARAVADEVMAPRQVMLWLGPVGFLVGTDLVWTRSNGAVGNNSASVCGSSQ